MSKFQKQSLVAMKTMREVTDLFVPASIYGSSSSSIDGWFLVGWIFPTRRGFTVIMCELLTLPDALLAEIFSKNLEISDVATLDSAICATEVRQKFLDVVQLCVTEWPIIMECKIQKVLQWASRRRLKFLSVVLSRLSIEEVGLLLERTGVHVEEVRVYSILQKNEKLHLAQLIQKVVYTCLNLKKLKCYQCDMREVTFTSLFTCCPKLSNIDIT